VPAARVVYVVTGGGKENAVWTSNHKNAVLLVVLTLMTLVQTRLLFVRDRAVDQRILAEVAGELGKEERFQNVRIEVEDMTVRLRGAVSLLEDKRQAIQKAQTSRDVRMVISHITVKTERMPDALPRDRLRERVTQDQNDTIRLQVKKGGVTIRGTVRDDAHRESVLSTVAGTLGVVWIEDRLQVDGNKRGPTI
jgi:osmotically-inducible protein OsmY